MRIRLEIYSSSPAEINSCTKLAAKRWWWWQIPQPLFVCSSFFCAARWRTRSCRARTSTAATAVRLLGCETAPFAPRVTRCVRLPPRLALTPHRPLAVPPSPLRADPIYLKPQSVGDIKVGGYSMCKGFPCKVRARLAALAASVAPPRRRARGWRRPPVTPRRPAPVLLASCARRFATTARPRRASMAPPRPCTAALTSSRASATTTAVRRLLARGAAARRAVAARSAHKVSRACLPPLRSVLPPALFLRVRAGPTSSMTWEPIGAPPRSRAVRLSSRAHLRAFLTACLPAARRPTPCLRAAVERKEYQIMDLNDRDVNEKGAIVSICDEAGETVDDLRVPIEGEEKAECVGCGPPPPRCGAVARACPVWPAALRLPRPPSPSRAARCPPSPQVLAAGRGHPGEHGRQRQGRLRDGARGLRPAQDPLAVPAQVSAPCCCEGGCPARRSSAAAAERGVGEG